MATDEVGIGIAAKQAIQDTVLEITLVVLAALDGFGIGIAITVSDGVFNQHEGRGTLDALF